MRWLKRERTTMDRLLPGLDEALADLPLMELEEQPTMDARETDDGIILNGTKKPCSLSYSMDMMTASILLPSSNGEGEQLAVTLIPGSSDGIERTPFWSSPILAAAESHAVTLKDV